MLQLNFSSAQGVPLYWGQAPSRRPTTLMHTPGVMHDCTGPDLQERGKPQGLKAINASANTPETLRPYPHHTTVIHCNATNGPCMGTCALPQGCCQGAVMNLHLCLRTGMQSMGTDGPLAPTMGPKRTDGIPLLLIRCCRL